MNDTNRQSREESLNSKSSKRKRGESFPGFKYPDANFILCPNQFFDVCLAHCSRGAVRFIAYLIRRTLGWRDENGDPLELNITVSHQDFIDKAGISKGAIGYVSDEVVDLGFANCIQRGKSKSKGSAGKTAVYNLRYDERGEYVTNLKQFQGFYAGGGHFTPIPNDFFDHVVASKRLSVTKVVGTVLRYTIGFESKYGGRRPQASLPLSFLQRYANIEDRTTAEGAVKEARVSNFIHRVHEGCFDYRSSVQRAATYAPVWLAEATNSVIGSKTLTAQQKRFKNQTSIGSKIRPVERFKNQTSIKTVTKDTLKQQQKPAVAAENKKAYELLTDQGFDRETASDLAKLRTSEEIENQIKWLPLRNPKKNELGLLFSAIEGNWSKPSSPENDAKQKTGLREKKRNVEQQTKEAAVDKQLKEQQSIRKNRMTEWHALSDNRKSHFYDLTLKQITSASARARIRTNHEIHKPAPEVLAVMAKSQKTSGVPRS